MRWSLFVAIAGCSVTRPAENGAQDMVLLGSPTYENITGRPTDPVQLAMISSIIESVPVGYVVNDPAERDSYADQLVADYGVDQDTVDENLVPIEIEHTDIWFRDMGGIFESVSGPGFTTHAVVDFEFNGWGYGPFSTADQNDLYAIDNQVSNELAAWFGYPVIYSPLTTEGGAFQSNGAGVIAYSLQALQQRNPGWTQSMIETELKRVTGAKKLLAIPTFHPLDGHAVLDGPIELDGEYYQLPVTVRHADEVMQFVNANTILVSQLDQADVTNDVEQQVHDRLADIWNFLAAATDDKGKKFTLVAFPDPGFMSEEGAPGDVIWDYLGTMTGIQHWDPNGGHLVVAGTYMNYVTTNDTVLVPTFYKDGRSARLIDTDAEALSILAAQYPTRTVIPIDPDNVNIGGGGMHCISQEIRSL